MKRSIAATMVAVLLCSTAFAAPADDPNSLEVVFLKFSGIEFNYEIWFFTSKVDAATCELATLTGTYTLVDYGGGEFGVGQDFVVDNQGLSFAELTGRIGGDWTLTWDEGLPAETVATLSFGTIAENQFLLMPTITFPVEGVDMVNPDPNPPLFEWDYGPIHPCQAQPDNVAVFLRDPAGFGEFYDITDCNTVSWTPPGPLCEGSWLFHVFNMWSIRDVPDGIQVTGDPWVLDNSDWLTLASVGGCTSMVVPTQLKSLGAVKSLYR